MGDEFLTKLGKRIATLKQELADCENAKAVYLREMGKEEASIIKRHRIITPLFPQAQAIDSRPISKKGAVIQLLKQHGPLSRKQIAAMTGFKSGTLAFTLSGDKKTFFNKDGLWHLREEGNVG